MSVTWKKKKSEEFYPALQNQVKRLKNSTRIQVWALCLLGQYLLMDGGQGISNH